jgi:N-acetylgalactosamine-N,N'-diacetylbacillosaminyl-diphospho-undecaprenol 4-alpha-N-acetylgalactosaminyltransferase
MQSTVTNVSPEQSARSGAASLARIGSKPRVMFLINSLAGGGAERVMCTLLRHSESLRGEFDMTLVLLDNEERANTPPEWLDVRQLDCAKSSFKSLLGVRKLIRELKPDVTVSFLTRANVVSVLNARGPCIISERANTAFHFPRTLGGFVLETTVRATYPFAARVIAVSEGVAGALRDQFGVPANRIVTIPNPVDIAAINAFADEPPAVDFDGPFVLAVGRLIRPKNFAMLIRAFATSGIEGKLVIAGEGVERANLQRTAQVCGIADRVLLPGFMSNPYALMRRAYAFVLSSSVEGFPNALVEAMAAGAPVIATNCPSGPSEILAEAPREYVSGLTFAKHGILTPMDDMDAMAEALRSLQDKVRRDAYVEKARARAGDFAVAVAAARYWDVVREVLAERR